MAKRKMTVPALSKAVPMDRSLFGKYESGAAQPSIDKFCRIAELLGVTPDQLLGISSPPVRKIPLSGYVSAGDGWCQVDDADSGDTVEVDLPDAGLMAIEVRGDSMFPAYRSGDVLICSKRSLASLDSLYGQDCAVRTIDGDGYIKVLHRGSKRGTVLLKSYNPTYENIEIIPALVAPILWVKRRSK